MVGLSVAIVGGGIGGIAAALSLHRVGLDVNVFEQARDLREAGAGIQINPNASRILHRLGLAGQLADMGVKPLALHQHRWDDGRTLLRTPLAEVMEAAFGSPHYQMHHADVLETLFAALPSDRVHLGHRLASFIDHRALVDAHFENGARINVDVLWAPMAFIPRYDVYYSDQSNRTSRAARAIAGSTLGSCSRANCLLRCMRVPSRTDTLTLEQPRGVASATDPLAELLVAIHCIQPYQTQLLLSRARIQGMDREALLSTIASYLRYSKMDPSRCEDHFQNTFASRVCLVDRSLESGYVLAGSGQGRQDRPRA